MSNPKKNIRTIRYAISSNKNDEAYELLKIFGNSAYIDGIGSVLSIACMSENWEIARFCIENGADVNSLDCEKGTALIDACKYGNLETIKLLIENGANVNIKNKYDCTAIAKAIVCIPTNYEIIEHLLKHGANPHIKEEYMADDPRITTHSAYEFAVQEIADPKLIALLDKYDNNNKNKSEKKPTPLKVNIANYRSMNISDITQEDYSKILKYIWKNFVPKRDHAKFVQGELLRAVEKLRDEAQRNGNINFKEDFHGALVNYLKEKLSDKKLFDKKTIKQIHNDLLLMNVENQPHIDDDIYDRINFRIVDWYLHYGDNVKVDYPFCFQNESDSNSKNC